MSDVTLILHAIENGESDAAEQLLPLIYGELRRLATAKLAHEQAGHTLQATALVHEAYLRLVDTGRVQSWNSRGHFFAAAAEAMRRILVESARRKQALKNGGGRVRQDVADVVDPSGGEDHLDDLLSLNDVLDKLNGEDSVACELVKLRYFAGLTIPEAATALGISPRKADMIWAYARAWLRQELEG